MARYCSAYSEMNCANEAEAQAIIGELQQLSPDKYFFWMFYPAQKVLWWTTCPAEYVDIEE